MRRTLSRALAGRPLIFVVCLGHWSLSDANSVLYRFREGRLRTCRGKNHCRTKQKGIACHWFLALWVIVTRIDVGPRRSMQVDDCAPARLEAPAWSNWKRPQHAKTAAKVPEHGIQVGLLDDFSQAQRCFRGMIPSERRRCVNQVQPAFDTL